MKRDDCLLPAFMVEQKSEDSCTDKGYQLDKSSSENVYHTLKWDERGPGNYADLHTAEVLSNFMYGMLGTVTVFHS